MSLLSLSLLVTKITCDSGLPYELERRAGVSYLALSTVFYVALHQTTKGEHQHASLGQDVGVRE